MEWIRGTSGHDELIGTNADDLIEGLAGDDRLVAGGGDNILLGGAGDDRLIAGSGRNAIDGGAGGYDYAYIDRSSATGAIHFSLANPATRQTLDNGTTIVNTEMAFLRTGAGDDVLTAGRRGDTFRAGAGDDQLEGGAGFDELYGEEGNDRLQGGDGFDRLEGGNCDDIVIGNRGGWIIDGGAGNDHARLQFEDSDGNLTFSVAGNLAGTVYLERTQVRGFERVVFQSGSGDDDIAGGELFDILRSGSGDDTLRGGGGDDWLYGEGGDDLLYGGSGNNIVNGGAGVDRLISSGERDTLDGGAGNYDSADIDRAGATGAIHFSLTNPALLQTLDDGTTVVNVEYARIRTGAGNDQLTGGWLIDTFHAGAGEDWLKGGGGRDRLFGEEGNDNLYGEDGGDWLEGGNGDDLIVGERGDQILDGGAGNDRARLQFEDSNENLTFSVAGNLAGTVYLAGTQVRGFEQVTFESGSGDDMIAGGALSDVLRGGSGGDVLRGQGGNDWLHGEGGNDRQFGGSGDDLVNGHGGNDYLKGEGGNDTIVGGSGRDTAAYSGSVHDYRADLLADGSIRITDIRGGSPDGVDIVKGVELFEFAGGRTASLGQLLQAAGNHAPQAAADAINLNEDGAPIRVDLLANDQDPDGDTVSIVSVDGNGLIGRLVQNADGTFSYSPDGKFEGLAAGQTATEAFTYTVRDPGGLTSTATVTVTVEGRNDAPTARGEAIAIAKTGTAILGNLLSNDSDVDRGDSISLGRIDGTSAKGASIRIDAEGRAIYDPGNLFDDLAPGETATDSFSYTVTDRSGATSSATVTITVSGGSTSYDPVLAFTESVPEDETIDLYRMLAEVYASYGPGTTLISVDNTGTLGTVTFDPQAGILTYAADHPSLDSLAPDRVGLTSFAYTVRLPSGELRTGVATMQVLGINDPIVAADDTLAVSKGPTVDIQPILVANDIDPDGGAFLFTDVDTAGTLGRIEFDPLSGTFRYAADTPELLALAPGETIVDHFTYTITDGVDGDDGPRSTATVAVTVTGGQIEFVI